MEMDYTTIILWRILFPCEEIKYWRQERAVMMEVQTMEMAEARFVKLKMGRWSFLKNALLMSSFQIQL